MVVGTALNSQPHLACQHHSGRHKTSMFFLSFSFSHEIFYSYYSPMKESIDWHFHPIQYPATHKPHSFDPWFWIQKRYS